MGMVLCMLMDADIKILSLVMVGLNEHGGCCTYLPGVDVVRLTEVGIVVPTYAGCP